MLTPAIVNRVRWFYPVGNTPAVSLTQTLPAHEPANILLLGSGDIRNILFTTHVDGSRSMDITACDNEKAILARNILLLSLLIDGGKTDDNVWNMYFHLYVDKRSLELLRTQAQKLHGLSSDMTTWESTKYGTKLKFCDSATLDDVRKMWEFYAQQRSGAEVKRFERRFERVLQAARDRHQGVNLTALRSAIPNQLEAGSDVASLNTHYWKYGNTELDPSLRDAAKHPNPFFLTLEDEAIVHYGTNPLLGFHLALAYASLTADDPLARQLKGLPRLSKVVKAARVEFRDWIASYRKHANNVTIRFVASDAVALALTLQHKRVSEMNTANHYRQQYDPKPLILDGPDYEASVAPLEFDVIDTSNLCDHFGSLVLFIACSPLLSSSASSVLYAEILAQLHQGHRDVLNNMLCGDVVTLTSLLGLFPVDYWTNTSPLSVQDEEMYNLVINASSQELKGERITRQLYLRTRWKRPSCWLISPHEQCYAGPRMHFEAEELAYVLYGVYLNMFRDEDMMIKLAHISVESVKNASFVWYHRTSFVSLIRLAKTRVVCSWDSMMTILVTLIRSRQHAPMGMNYIQDLFTSLHLFDLHSEEYLLHWDQRHSMSSSFASIFQDITSRVMPIDDKWGDLRDWKDLPSVVSVTVVVPRKALRVFTDMDPKRLGTPTLHCLLQSGSTNPLNSWQNLFPTCHLAFGSMSTQGTRHSDSFKIVIMEDLLGWNGSSALIASFFVPSFTLLLEPQKAIVALGVHSTPATVAAFVGELGMMLNVFQTTLDNSENVFITRYAPNQGGLPSIPGFAEAEPEAPESFNKGAQTSLSVRADLRTRRVVSVTGRVDLTSDHYKSELQSGCTVETRMLSPCFVTMAIGRETPLAIAYPVAVVENSKKTRIARKSAYVEVIADVETSLAWTRYTDYMYPVHLRSGVPVCEGLTYLNLHRCPVIDKSQPSKLQWLNVHLSGAFSYRETQLRNNTNLPRSIAQRTRLDFKESIFSILVQFAGIQGHKSRVFGLNNVRNGGIHILILASCLRLDLSNRVVVLDCAVIPLHTDILNNLAPFLDSGVSQGICQIKVDDEELRLWKNVLPAYVERCRLWNHQKNCEYAKIGQVPLTVEQGKKFLCTCGNSHFPKDFITGLPHWTIASKYAVRAAISPPFWAPFAEDLRCPDMSKDRNKCATCGKESKDGKELLTCGRCGQVKYCDRVCQRANWPVHKAACK